MIPFRGRGATCIAGRDLNCPGDKSNWMQSRRGSGPHPRVGRVKFMSCTIASALHGLPRCSDAATQHSSPFTLRSPACARELLAYPPGYLLLERTTRLLMSLSLIHISEPTRQAEISYA